MEIFLIAANTVLNFLCLTCSGCLWVKVFLLFASENKRKSTVVFHNAKNL